MKLKSVEIQGYKGIRNLNFDVQPDITCLLGENGTGKTTILECLSNFLNYNNNHYNSSNLINPPAFHVKTTFELGNDEKERFHFNSNLLSILTEPEVDNKPTISFLDANSAAKNVNFETIKQHLPEFVYIDTINYSQNFIGDIPDMDVDIENSHRDYINMMFEGSNLNPKKLKNILNSGSISKNAQAKDTIESLGKSFNSELTKYGFEYIEISFEIPTTNPDNSPYYLKCNIEDKSRGDSSDNFQDQSAGIKYILNLIYYLKKLVSNNSNKIILIESPDRDLHYSAQKLLIKSFTEHLSKNSQVIYTTHSPYFTPIEEHQYIFCFNRGVEGIKCKSYNNLNDDEKENLRLNKLLYFSHLLNNRDKLLNAEYCIFCEGEKTDEAIYNKIFENHINKICFIGVGSCGEIEKFLKSVPIDSFMNVMEIPSTMEFRTLQDQDNKNIELNNSINNSIIQCFLPSINIECFLMQEEILKKLKHKYSIDDKVFEKLLEDKSKREQSDRPKSVRELNKDILKLVNWNGGKLKFEDMALKYLVPLITKDTDTYKSLEESLTLT